MRKSILIILAVPFLLSPIWSQEEVGFSSGLWKIDRGSRIEEFLGREALTGSAMVRDVEFTNGIIEVDIACRPGRVFPGIVFRQRNQANYEEFYIRPHKSGQPDALQYTPVFNGLSAWQLYYGEGYTGPWTFPLNEWIHIRMEISGNQARVIIGEGERPALVIHDLKHLATRGGIGVKITGPVGVAYFSNFRYELDDELTFDPPPKIETPLGMIKEWDLSPPYKYNEIDMKQYPGGDRLAAVPWRIVISEPTGLVNVSRYEAKGPLIPGCVLARTRIRADREKLMPLQFGYSDNVSIFLNGRLLFNGSNLFRLRDPFFQGYVGLFDSVYLPLKEGDNELLLILAESSGGWGFICRAGDAVFLDESMEEIWRISHELSYPETVIYDKERDVLYVSNYLSDGSQSLSKVSLEGEVERAVWISDLVQPTGMAIRDDTLFVVERTHLAEVDIPSSRLRRYPIPDPGFPNDVAVDEKGNLYVTDGQKGAILKFNEGNFTFWKAGSRFAQVNGIHYAEGKIFVACNADARILSIDLETDEMRTVGRFDKGTLIDGIETDEAGNLLVSDYQGKIFRITPEGQKQLLLDATAPKQYCANFAYIPEKSLLIVPTLTDNRIVAFTLKNRDPGFAKTFRFW